MTLRIPTSTDSPALIHGVARQVLTPDQYREACYVAVRWALTPGHWLCETPAPERTARLLRTQLSVLREYIGAALHPSEGG